MSKKDYKIFFAIPFDSVTKEFYEKYITNEIEKFYKSKGYNIITIIGTQQVGLSQEYFDVLTFKAQNTEMQKQFLLSILESNVIIADLTNNNPNVHIELGVALTLSKNILRVSGRPTKELGFDIQNLEVYIYRDREDLLEKIKKYMDMFLKIKNLPFSSEYGDLYYIIPNSKTLPLNEDDAKQDKNRNIVWLGEDTGFRFRDGAMQYKFKLKYFLNATSWFGIYFRASVNIFDASYLIHIRQNGSIELAIYPGPKVVIFDKLDKSINENDEVNVLLEIENDHFNLKVNNKNIYYKGLKHQDSGLIRLASWQCCVEFSKFEMINRDTINEF